MKIESQLIFLLLQAQSLHSKGTSRSTSSHYELKLAEFSTDVKPVWIPTPTVSVIQSSIFLFAIFLFTPHFYLFFGQHLSEENQRTHFTTQHSMKRPIHR